MLSEGDEWTNCCLIVTRRSVMMVADTNGDEPAWINSPRGGGRDTPGRSPHDAARGRAGPTAKGLEIAFIGLSAAVDIRGTGCWGRMHGLKVPEYYAADAAETKGGGQDLSGNSSAAASTITPPSRAQNRRVLLSAITGVVEPGEVRLFYPVVLPHDRNEPQNETAHRP